MDRSLVLKEYGRAYRHMNWPSAIWRGSLELDAARNSLDGLSRGSVTTRLFQPSWVVWTEQPRHIHLALPIADIEWEMNCSSNLQALFVLRRCDCYSTQRAQGWGALK